MRKDESGRSIFSEIAARRSRSARLNELAREQGLVDDEALESPSQGEPCSEVKASVVDEGIREAAYLELSAEPLPKETEESEIPLSEEVEAAGEDLVADGDELEVLSEATKASDDLLDLADAEEPAAKSYFEDLDSTSAGTFTAAASDGSSEIQRRVEREASVVSQEQPEAEAKSEEQPSSAVAEEADEAAEISAATESAFEGSSEDEEQDDGNPSAQERERPLVSFAKFEEDGLPVQNDIQEEEREALLDQSDAAESGSAPGPGEDTDEGVDEPLSPEEAIAQSESPLDEEPQALDEAEVRLEAESLVDQIGPIVDIQSLPKTRPMRVLSKTSATKPEVKEAEPQRTESRPEAERPDEKREHVSAEAKPKKKRVSLLDSYFKGL